MNVIHVTDSTKTRGRGGLGSDKIAGKDGRKRGGGGEASLLEKSGRGPGNYRNYTIIIIDRPLNLRTC